MISGNETALVRIIQIDPLILNKFLAIDIYGGMWLGRLISDKMHWVRMDNPPLYGNGN